MGATTHRAWFALLLSAALLAGLMVVSVVAVGADGDDDEMKKAFEQAGLEWSDGSSDGADDDDDGSGVTMDALSGLAAGRGGDTSDSEPTGDLNDPLAGGAGGISDDADVDQTSGAEPGTTDGSDRTDPVAYSTNPMFKLMADLILSEVKAAEDAAKKQGRTLSEAERAAVATGAARRLITFLQQANELLGEGASGDAQANELLKQIMSVPTEPEDPSSKPSRSSESAKTDETNGD